MMKMKQALFLPLLLVLWCTTLVVLCFLLTPTHQSQQSQDLYGLQVHVALTGKPNQYSIMCITDPYTYPYLSRLSLVFEYKLNNDSSQVPYTRGDDDSWISHSYRSHPYYTANVHEFLFTVPVDVTAMTRVFYRIGIKDTQQQQRRRRQRKQRRQHTDSDSDSDSDGNGDYRFTRQFSFEAHTQTRVSSSSGKHRQQQQQYTHNEDDSFTFITFGDMDTTFPAQRTMSHLAQLIADGSKQSSLSDHVHLIIHQGDIPYAWSEDKWDTWGTLIEPVASSIPYMTVPGNHESDYGFASYRNRFSNMTSKHSASPQGNLYYSFDYRTVHFVGLSSEHDFSPGSQQYLWLLNDLQQVDRRRTPFVITFSHRPQYSSNVNHGSALDFRRAIEPVLVKFKVDLSLFGHVHAYERTCPIVGDGVCDSQGVTNLCVGTAGFELNPDWEQQPAWSKYRETAHGVARVKVNGSKSLKIHFLPNDSQRIVDEHEIFVRPEFNQN